MALRWSHPEGPDWFETVLTPDGWQDPSTTAYRSESRPEWYRRGRDGLIALAKPNDRRGDGFCRCAHEKIAADLAFLIGFPIPPVVLWDRGDAGLYSLSAAAFRQTTPLSEYAEGRMIPPDIQRELLPYVEWSRVFHLWIQDEDRKAAHIMVNDTAPPGQGEFAFIDHAFSMSKPWEDQGAEELLLEDMEDADGISYISKMERDMNARRAAVAAVQGLNAEQIDMVVRRIPDRFLSSARKILILERLEDRRSLLSKLF